MIDIAIESDSEESKNEKNPAIKTGNALIIPVVEEQAQVAKQSGVSSFARS